METVVCCGFFCNRKRQLRAKGEEHEILSFVGSAYWKAVASLQYDRRTAGYIRENRGVGRAREAGCGYHCRGYL